MTLKINKDRLWNRHEKLAEFTEGDRPWTRRAFSELYIEARKWLKDEMRASGLDVRMDAGGNMIGRLSGSGQGLAPIASGSHSDTVPRGGRFDGISGVLAALEVAQTLSESNYPLRHPYEVIDFLAEEPNDYGVSCVGSRAMTGELSKEILNFTAPDGSTLAEGIDRVGGRSSDLGKALYKKGDLAGFVELHIEQGPVLEAEALDVGIVTDIVGITRINMEISGRAAHSGTAPMDIRRDALVGASTMISEINDLAKAWLSRDEYLVATVGKLNVVPNGSNVVPGRVNMVLEVRSNENSARDEYVEKLLPKMSQIASMYELGFSYELVSRSTAVPCSKQIQSAIFAACEKSGAKYKYMSSGAGHDAAHTALFCPSGMIFIPCLKGVSHNPEEYASAEQLSAGTQVLLDTICILDHQ